MFTSDRVISSLVKYTIDFSEDEDTEALLELFFFQAEDGIRAFHVTGVQTCALPISSPRRRLSPLAFTVRCATSRRAPGCAGSKATSTADGTSGARTLRNQVNEP